MAFANEGPFSGEWLLKWNRRERMLGCASGCLCVTAFDRAAQEELDVALSSSPGPDNIMALGGSTGHSNGLGPGDDMALNNNMTQAWLSPWSQVTVKAIQIRKAPVAVLCSDTNLAPSGGPDLWHRHGFQ